VDETREPKGINRIAKISYDYLFPRDLILIFGVLTPLSTIFQLYHGDQL
jgi:hypothetical protein